MIKINEYELEELDLLDAEVLEKYENALDDVMENTKNITSDKSSEVIKKCCKQVYKFFDLLWGEGTGEKVFKGKYNILVCFDAFDEVNKKAAEQRKVLDERFNKYSPNRAERRSKGNK